MDARFYEPSERGWRRHIPGHFVANEIARACFLLVFGSYAAFQKGSWLVFAAIAIGVVLMVLGSFTSEQTTHLRQPAHDDPAPTEIERGYQAHPWLWRPIGWVGEGVGYLTSLLAMQ